MKIENIIDSLAQDRHFFHFEADFQIALAEKISKEMATSKTKIYLEKKIRANGKTINVDIAVSSSNKTYFIEVKFATSESESSEIQKLRNRDNDSNVIQFKPKQPGRDLIRYGFWKDVERLQDLVNREKESVGYAIFLTTDSKYWDEQPWDINSDREFKMCKQRIKVNIGKLEWRNEKTEKSSISIKNEYLLDRNWHKYGETGQYLLLKILPSKE